MACVCVFGGKLVASSCVLAAEKKPKFNLIKKFNKGAILLCFLIENSSVHRENKTRGNIGEEKKTILKKILKLEKRNKNIEFKNQRSSE